MSEASTAKRHNTDTPIAAIVAVIATLIGILVLLWAILYITKGRFLERPFERYASRQVGRPVEVGGDFQLYLNPHIKFRAEKLTVDNPDWANTKRFVDAALVDLRLDVLKLIFGETFFRDVTLRNAAFALEWDAEGKRNTWTFADEEPEPFKLPTIRRAAISGTTLTYRDPPRQLFADIGFEPIAARSSRFDSAIGFNGRGTSMRAPFRVSGRLDSPNATAAGGRNDLSMRIDVGDSRIDVAGTLPGATELDGANLKVRARGANLVTPFRLLAVAVPETRRFDLSADLKPRGDEWRFTGIGGSFGDTDLSGRMTVDTGRERLFIDAELASKRLDIIDAAPWMGISAAAVEKLGAKGLIETVNGRPRVLPDAPLNSEGLARLDATLQYRAAAVRTGTVPVQNLALTLVLDNRLLTLKPLSFDFAGGKLVANIDLNARSAPVVTKYDIDLSPVRIRDLMRGFDVEGTGTTGTIRGRVDLTGYGDSLRASLGSAGGRAAFILPQGNFWLRNAELLELDIGDFVEAALGKKLKEPARIRCGLLAFSFKDGIGRADPIFIDTQKNIIRGGGTISLKDESFDLAVEADAKNPSLFSGQSPIGVGGWFAAPTIDPISGDLVRRAAAGVALGVLLTPFAALAAFVDIGDEENTNCAPVLAGKRAPAVEAADRAAEKS